MVWCMKSSLHFAQLVAKRRKFLSAVLIGDLFRYCLGQMFKTNVFTDNGFLEDVHKINGRKTEKLGFAPKAFFFNDLPHSFLKCLGNGEIHDRHNTI